MKAGRGIYDSGDVSVKTARSRRSKNRYKKARNWDRVNIYVWGKLSSSARSFFSWQQNLMVSARFLSLRSPREA